MSETRHERAVARMRRADLTHQRALERERATYGRRVAAVEHARAEGVTYRVCAETLGISIEAITKMLVKARRDRGE